ncbi:MAG: hypothetical protein IT258_15945 [Saprospiraceae bacterium]|nr:hypothetical protein [Saprospiraceae bacterium]
MGPPLHESPDADWQRLDSQGAAVATEAEASQFRFNFTDPLPPSWFPYYYRAVAVGVNDLTQGWVAGRSAQSNLVKVENLPTGPPMLSDEIGEQTGSNELRLRFRSDALLEATPLGRFKVEITPWDYASNSFTAASLVSTFLTDSAPNPGAAGQVPNKLYHSIVQVNGVRQFEARFNLGEDKYLYKIRLTDPLERATERMISGIVEVNEAPHLEGLTFRKKQKDLFFAFESKNRVTPSPFGEFTLEISFTPIFAGAVLLFKTALHLVKVGDLAKLNNAQVSTLLREPKAGSQTPCKYGAVVKNFYPASPFGIRQGKLNIRLTAPDGAVAKLSINI